MYKFDNGNNKFEFEAPQWTVLGAIQYPKFTNR